MLCIVIGDALAKIVIGRFDTSIRVGSSLRKTWLTPVSHQT